MSNFLQSHRLPTAQINTDFSIDKSTNRINFGTADGHFAGGSFPSDLIALVDSSVTASATIDTKQSFIQGSGFEDEKHKDLVLNSSGDTLHDIHELNTEDLALFSGCYMKVTYNDNNKKVKWENLSFEMCRLVAPDTSGKISRIIFNRNFGNTFYKKSEDVIYPIFNDNPDIVKQQKELWAEEGLDAFPGQVMTIFLKRPGQRFYPIPAYISAQEWMNVDAKIGTFHSSNIDNNFFLSIVMRKKGNPNDQVDFPDNHVLDTEGNPTGEVKRKMTYGKQHDIQMEALFSGATKTGFVMTEWSMTEDGFTQIEAFPQQANDELFVVLDEQTKSNITISQQVPRILANIMTQGSLGASQEVENAVKFLHGKCVKPQLKLESAYKKMLRNSENIKELTNQNPGQNVVDQEPKILPFEFTLQAINDELQNKDPEEQQEPEKKEETQESKETEEDNVRILPNAG